MFSLKRSMLILAVAAIPSLLSAGLLEYGYYGTRSCATDGRTAALNLAGVSIPGGGLLNNPALPACGTGFALSVSGDLMWRRETRNREVFDSYSNSVGLNTEAVNSETHVTLQGFSLSYAAKAGPLPALALSVGVRPEYDFRYQYHRDVRDGFFALTEQYDTESKGTIYGYSFALSCRPLKRLAAGIGLTRLSGKQDIASQALYEDPTLQDVHWAMTDDFKGSRLDCGLWGAVTNRISAGVTYRSPAKLSQGLHMEQTIGAARGMLDTSGTVKYPAEYTVGVTYKPTNSFPATVTLEYAHSSWDKLTNDLDTVHTLAAVNRYSLGITHVVGGGLPLHFGISFENSFQGAGIGLARAGLGTEVSVLRMRTQIGVNAGRRSYNYGQAFKTTSDTNVTETFADLVITFSME